MSGPYNEITLLILYKKLKTIYIIDTLFLKILKELCFYKLVDFYCLKVCYHVRNGNPALKYGSRVMGFYSLNMHLDHLEPKMATE